MNNHENAALLAEILKTIPPEFIEVQDGPKKKKKIIDIGLYKSTQQLRLFGSQKPTINSDGETQNFHEWI